MNKKAEVYAKHKNASIAPKKVAPVMNLIRGKGVSESKVILAFDRTKAAKLILKVVKSAEANAKNNLNKDPSKMYISDLYVDGGRMAKRARMAARGRISPILKRTSHITVGLSETGAIHELPVQKGGVKKKVRVPVRKDKAKEGGKK